MKILLGTKSPRRQTLLSQMDISFEAVGIECNEDFKDVAATEVALYLARKKSHAYTSLQSDELLITADTTVMLGERVINKPEDEAEAIQMLKSLSGKQHMVNTAVCLRSLDIEHHISEFSKVWFGEFSEEELKYYIDKYQPYDKAGSYGIQEWLGLCKISKIEGCYYNIMGLPTARLYDVLKTEFGL